MTKSEFESLVTGCCSTHLVTHSPVVVKIEAVVVFGERVCLSRPKDAQLRSGDLDGQGSTATLEFVSNAVVILAVWGRALPC